ncbi:MAG: polyprenol monophosphomannose synthase [Legionellales bacterium]|nr:polyprenol monophosphomannose synthase [Legionellales bacterium]
MKKAEKLIIIIPTYDEEAMIAVTIQALQENIAKINGFDISILVFDSHSRDNTVNIIKQLQQHYSNLYLQTEAEKSGLGSAYIQAMQYAMTELKADVVIEYDADGSHQPHYLAPMLALLNEGYDVVLASRYLKDGGLPDNWNWYRKGLSIAGNWVARLFLTTKYTDFTSGFRITRTSCLKKIDLTQLLSKEYAYKIHLLWGLHQQEANIVEYPIIFVDRLKGYSKFPRNNILDSLRVVIILRWRVFRGKL